MRHVVDLRVRFRSYRRTDGRHGPRSSRSPPVCISLRPLSSSLSSRLRRAGQLRNRASSFQSHADTRPQVDWTNRPSLLPGNGGSSQGVWQGCRSLCSSPSCSTSMHPSCFLTRRALQLTQPVPRQPRHRRAVFLARRKPPRTVVPLKLRGGIGLTVNCQRRGDKQTASSRSAA